MIRFNNIQIERKTRTILHGNVARVFHDSAVVLFKMIQHLLLTPHGLNVEELWTRIYGSTREDGPDVGPHNFQVKMHKAEPTFTELNLRLVSERRAGSMRYRLLPIESGDYTDAHEGIPVRAGRTHTQNLIGS